MERLGVGTKREYIRDYTLRWLTQIRPALIKGHGFGVIARIGRLEQVYHLTEKGAKTVAELLQVDFSEITYPKYGLRFQNDYFHRKPNTKYITQQLDRHITAIDQTIIAEHFEHSTPNIVLSVHEHFIEF